MMWKFYFKTVAAAMAALLIFAGCSKSEETKTPPPGPVTPGNLTLSVGSITATSAVVTVTPTNAEGTYYAYVISKTEYEQYESDAQLMEDDVMSLKDEAQMEGKKLEDFLYKGTKPVSLDLNKPNTEYYAYAYGLDAEGKATTALFKQAFTSGAGEPEKFALSVSNVKATTGTLSVVPADKSITYYFDVASDADMTEAGSIEAYLAEYIAMVCDYYQITPEEFVKEMCSVDDDSYDYDNLDPETMYHAFAIELDASGNPIGAATMAEFTTGAVEPSNLTFNIAVDNISATAAHILITPSTEEQYFCDIQQVALFDGLSDSEIIDMTLENYGSFLELMLGTGPYEYNVEDFELDYALEPDTEYYVYAFGYAGGVTTGLTKQKFKTEKGGDPAGVTFDIKVEVPSANKVGITVTPSDATVLYIWDIMSEAKYQEYGAAEAAGKALQSLYDSNIANGFTMAQIVAGLGVRGEDKYTAMLEPEKSYYVWAYCIDAEGTPVGQPGMSAKFTTPKAVISTASAPLSYTKYYNGDELNAADPVTFANTKGKAYVPVTITPTSNAAHWYIGLFNGDYTSLASASEELILSNLLRSTVKDVTSVNYLATWDSNATFLTVAEDADGNFGTSFRLLAKFIKANASPVSELLGAKAMKHSVSVPAAKSIVRKAAPKSYRPMNVNAASKAVNVAKSGKMAYHKPMGTAVVKKSSKKAVLTKSSKPAFTELRKMKR